MCEFQIWNIWSLMMAWGPSSNETGRVVLLLSFLKTKFAIPCPQSPYFNHSFNQAVEDLRCYLFYWINRINNALHPSLAVSPTSLIITTISPKQKINISDPSIRAESDLSPKNLFVVNLEICTTGSVIRF